MQPPLTDQSDNNRSSHWNNFNKRNNPNSFQCRHSKHCFHHNNNRNYNNNKHNYKDNPSNSNTNHHHQILRVKEFSKDLAEALEEVLAVPLVTVPPQSKGPVRMDGEPAQVLQEALAEVLVQATPGLVFVETPI